MITTYLIENGTRIQINSLDASSASFGMLAPNELSETSIIQLNASNVSAITNIRLALIDTGGIDFSDNLFGYDTRGFIDSNVVPENYFQGVSDKSEDSEYNIDISNLNLFSSVYVYLNLKVPIGQDFIGGTIRYQWIFDYA